ncbi:MAG: LptF/LptG family permease [Candidatus Omnitrophica bacterium]|nr:LptF/LptG family permease [Candidatus Omnitrophota bacterium]MCM8793155.1 LptF/LptG family permease [Candidatus Omnitrophota bacterium]
MRILRDYIFKEFLKPFGVYLFIFTFVLVSGNLIQLIELIITKGIPIWDIIKLFFWQIPSLLSYILPMAILTALLFGIGRLSSDLEIAAIKASGVNLLRLEIPLVLTGIAFSLFSLILNNEIIPYARFASRKIIKQVGIKNPLAYFEPGTFIKNFQNYILFFYGINENVLHHIRIYELKEKGFPRTIIAKKGKITSLPDEKTVKLELFSGTSDEPSPDDPRRFYKLNFKTYIITLKLPDEFAVENLGKKPKEMNIQELKVERERFLSQNIDISPLNTEIHKRIALSFACFTFVLIGFPLGALIHKKGNAVAFGLSLVVLGLYYLLTIVGEAFSRQGLLNPLFSMWMANISLGFLGIVLSFFVCRH